MMKSLFYLFLVGCCIYGCSSTRKSVDANDPYANVGEIENDTVHISNDSLEYEIIIIDPGYSLFLHSYAKPEGYYSLNYLENKNQFLVSDYNQRVRQPLRYPDGMYTLAINYDPFIDYGYEVNYKLYNYFVYLTHRYNQHFSVPTRL